MNLTIIPSLLRSPSRTLRTRRMIPRTPRSPTRSAVIKGSSPSRGSVTDTFWAMSPSTPSRPGSIATNPGTRLLPSPSRPTTLVRSLRSISPPWLVLTRFHLELSSLLSLSGFRYQEPHLLGPRTGSLRFDLRFGPEVVPVCHQENHFSPVELIYASDRYTYLANTEQSTTTSFSCPLREAK